MANCGYDWELIHRGAYPELQDAGVAWSDFYASYVKTYIASEIGKDVTTVKNWISILETSGIVYLLEPYSSDETQAFTVLDKIPDKKRGAGAVVCMCPQPGALRDNVLQIPVWYI